MAEPSLIELIEKQRTGKLTESEQKVLNQKLGNLDSVASAQGAFSLRPTGNRTYGQYNFYIDWQNDGAPTQVINYAKNPSFEVNVTDDTTLVGAAAVAAQDGTAYQFGSYSCKITAGSAASYITTITGVSVASAASVSGSVYCKDAGVTEKGKVEIYDTTNSASRATDLSSGAGAFERLSCSWINDTGSAVTVQLRCHNLYDDSASIIKYDGRMLELATTSSAYTDGAQGDGFWWDGTAHNSESQYNGEWKFDGVYDNLAQRFVSADIMRGMAGENAYCAIPAQIEVQLDNTDNYLASDNGDSPVNAYVIGSAKKRCKLEIVVNGTTYQQFDGWVKEIASNPSTHGRKMATVVIDDLIGRLKAAPMISTIRVNATETSTLAMALGAAVWAAYGNSYYGATYYGGGGVYGGQQVLMPIFDTATDTFAYVGDTWRESETSVLDAIQDIMRSCLGSFHANRRGIPVYRARTYRSVNATTSDWSTAGSTQTMKVDAVGIQDETLYNEVQLTINQRKAGTPASVLWTLRDEPSISAGATLTYVVSFNDEGTPCGCTDPVTPLIGTDYTNDPNLSISVVWRAADALVSVTNNGGSPITLALLQLRGTPITIVDKTLFKRTGTTAIKKTLWHDAPLLSSTVAAASYADWLYILFSLYTDRARQVTIVPGSATDLEAVAQLDVNRRITLIDGSIAYVNWVHHSITSSFHTVTLGLSPAISSVMWVLGVSLLGEDTFLGV